MNYEYPIDQTWTTEEIIDVVNFFSFVEKAHETKVRSQEILLLYNRFKQIVPSKSEEKKLFAQFEATSGYSSYKTVKRAKEAPKEVIKM